MPNIRQWSDTVLDAEFSLAQRMGWEKWLREIKNELRRRAQAAR